MRKLALASARCCIPGGVFVPVYGAPYVKDEQGDIHYGCLDDYERLVSYMMMGATSPVTFAATWAQGYAEVMLGLALTQLYRPGAPVVFGLYACPFSMRSMVPVFGDPVSWRVQFASAQLALRLGIPCRGDGGVTSAKTDDAQAGYEGGAASFAAVNSGADIIMHSAGWLDNARIVDFSKFDREAAALQQYMGWR